MSENRKNYGIAFRYYKNNNKTWESKHCDENNGEPIPVPYKRNDNPLTDFPLWIPLNRIYNMLVFIEKTIKNQFVKKKSLLKEPISRYLKH